jgi:hypothetical protein
MLTSAKQITSGENAGFYVLSKESDQIDTTGSKLFQRYRAYQQSLNPDNNLYHRYSPGPGKQITGFNRTVLPFIDGFYYVRKNADLPRLLYALENRLVPSDGNTELFNNQFTSIYVPDDWKPYLFEPCLKDWCSPIQLSNLESPKAELMNPSFFQIFLRLMFLAFFSMFLAALIMIIFVGKGRKR